MAKIDFVHERLEQWADWVARGRVCGGGGLSMFEGEPSDAKPQARMLLNEEECWRTEADIMALPEEQAWLVSAYYLHGSLFVRDRLSISSSTLSQRLDVVYRALAGKWARPSAIADQVPTAWRGSFTQ